MKVFLKWMLRFLPIGYAIMIWVLSGLPHNAIVELPNSERDHLFKESMHLIEFAILYLLLFLALLTTGNVTKKQNTLIALIAILYGLLDETHQFFVPYRSATIIDFAKDSIGVLVSYYFIGRGLKHSFFHSLSHYFKQEKG